MQQGRFRRDGMMIHHPGAGPNSYVPTLITRGVDWFCLASMAWSWKAPKSSYIQGRGTAYPRLKTSFNAGELDHWYTPTLEERTFCSLIVRGQSTRFGFLLLLKTFQRLGYFVTSDQIPDAI